MARPLPDQSGQLRAIYYDTHDHVLRREGISLRIRRRNGSAVQTIKAERENRGIAMDRGEWETPVEDELDLTAAVGTPLEPLLSQGELRDGIRPAFQVTTDRKAFEVAFDDALIEVAVDAAQASCDDRTIDFSEVELELREGSPAALFALARHLSEAAPLRLSTVAKSERGFRLVEDEPARASKAEKIELAKDATCAEAFQAIARSCLAQMVGNEPLVRETQNPAALHQMRVGLRRLRAALSLFKAQLLADPESAALKDNLRWAGQTLGTARDLDVLLERLRTQDEKPDRSQIDVVERRRSKAYEDLLETLDARRFMDVILQAAAWVEAGDWVSTEDRSLAKARQHPARDFASSELTRRFKRIRKLGKHLREISDEERHALRIRIKKLRYGSEFFASLYPSAKAQKRRKKLSAILEDLQERLGELNDLAVSNTLVPSMPEAAPERVARRRKDLLDESEAAAHTLIEAKPFWS